MKSEALSPTLATDELVRRVPGGVREIAEALEITTQAVYGWGVFVPPLRVYQLQAIRPEWFQKGST